MKIVQIVRYVEYAASAGPGTIALDDSGKLYRLEDDGRYRTWKEMPIPALPGNTLTLKPKAK